MQESPHNQRTSKYWKGVNTILVNTEHSYLVDSWKKGCFNLKSLDQVAPKDLNEIKYFNSLFLPKAPYTYTNIFRYGQFTLATS